MAEIVRRMVLEGGGRLEDVPAADIAVFIEGVVGAVARAAGHVIGRQVKPTGRRRSVVAAASEIRLVAIRSGSVEFTFAPAPDRDLPDGLEFDIESLSERALTVATAAAGEDAERYRDVARIWLNTADRLGVGTRYKQIRLLEGNDQELVRLNRDAVDRLRAIAGPRLVPEVPSGLQGRLYEANFDAHSAELRGRSGEIVRVQYDDAVADDIYRVLRGTANLIGDVTYDPVTLRATKIRVRQVQRPEQLDMSFWQEKPLAQLASEQGMQTIKDVDALVVHGLSHDDWEALREAMPG
jgi:hypothetical protein